MSAGLPPELRELVEAAPLVHLATVDPDGAPQVSARATVEPSDGAWDLLDRLTKLYMSPEDEFPRHAGPA